MSSPFKIGITPECAFTVYRAIGAANKSLISIAINKTLAHMHEYEINPPQQPYNLTASREINTSYSDT